MSELQRELIVYPAYDRRSEGYGQHCVDMLWLVKGELGVIQFRLFTGWSAAVIGKPDLDWSDLHATLPRMYETTEKVWPPMPADIGYHSPVPKYEGQEPMGKCDLLPQGFCYYDGSGLNADRYFSILVHEGGEALWKALEQYYAELFETTLAGESQ
jgi:hypothetical protein